MNNDITIFFPGKKKKKKVISFILKFFSVPAKQGGSLPLAFTQVKLTNNIQYQEEWMLCWGE